jgi:hypothetical protein
MRIPNRRGRVIGYKAQYAVGVAQGQAVVELAMTLPVLLLLILGLINLGLMINAQIVLTQAAWEGARAGATLTDPGHGDSEIIGAVLRAATGLDAAGVEIDIDPTQSQPPRNQPWPSPRGYPLTVRLSYKMTLALPFTPQVRLGAQAVSRMEYQNP